jgi:hypothetical protein
VVEQSWVEPREISSRPNRGRSFLYFIKVVHMLVKRVWLDRTEEFDALTGDVDVMIEMENGEVWTAHFVTLPYLQQQMQLSKAVADTSTTLGGVGFVALETPHVIVETLSQEAIEDIVDNLMILGTFEAVFDLVIDTPASPEDQMI